MLKNDHQRFENINSLITLAVELVHSDDVQADVQILTAWLEIAEAREYA